MANASDKGNGSYAIALKNLKKAATSVNPNKVLPFLEDSATPKSGVSPSSSSSSSLSSSSSSSSTSAGTPGFAAAKAEIGARDPNANFVDSNRVGLMPGQELADLYGINYDEGSIRAIFDQATEAKYDDQRAASDRALGRVYKETALQQGALLDTLRAANANAIQSGANKGFQSANKISAMLGVSQQGIDNVTTMAQERRALEEQEASEKALNARNAMDSANLLKQGVAAQAGVNYATDVQQRAAELGYNAQVGAAEIAAGAEEYAADTMLYGNLASIKSNEQIAAAARAASAAAASGNRDWYKDKYGTDVLLSLAGMGNVAAVEALINEFTIPFATPTTSAPTQQNNVSTANRAGSEQIK